MKLLILASPPQWGHQEMSQGMSAQSGGLELVHTHPQGSLAKANGGGAPPCFDGNKEPDQMQQCSG